MWHTVLILWCTATNYSVWETLTNNNEIIETTIACDCSNPSSVKHHKPENKREEI